MRADRPRCSEPGRGPPGSSGSSRALSCPRRCCRSLGRVLTTDVAVVGGGPAGVAAAVTLARAGRDVVLVDRARFPRDKCCGDGLTTGALRRLERLGLRPAAVASWMPASEAWERSPSGRVAIFPLPDGQGTFAATA